VLTKELWQPLRADTRAVASSLGLLLADLSDALPNLRVVKSPAATAYLVGQLI
jgi:hypothetical protein